MLPVNQAQKKIIERRAAAFRKVMAPLKLRGVGIRLGAFRNSPLTESDIMALVKKLGFNRIYCHISSELELAEPLEKLLAAASEAGIPVELTVRQGDFKHRFRGNALVRSLLPQFRTLPDLAEDIVDFNNSLPENARLAGVTVRFEPHLFSYANGADRIPGLFYVWNQNTFGPGLDNDKLVLFSLKQLEAVKKNLKTIPLTVELPDFYPLWAAEKKLSKGRVRDFAHIGTVLLQCTGNVPSELVKLSRTGLGEKRNLTAVIPLADHTSVRSGALRRRDWNDLVRSLGYFINSTRKYQCSGAVLRPLSELGYMLWEQD